MARRRKAVDATPPPPHPDPESDTGAEQQLFEEVEAASARKSRPGPTHSAVASANLLNAARYPTAGRQSKVGNGKLRRPTFMRHDLAELSRQNLAARRDVYDVPVDSPGKDIYESPFKLPTTMNKKPLKRVKKGKKGKEVEAMNSDRNSTSKQPAVRQSSADTGVAGWLSEVDVEGQPDQVEVDAGASSPPPTLPVLETPTLQTTLPLRKSKRKVQTEPSNLKRSKKSPRLTPTHDASDTAVKENDTEEVRLRNSHPKVVIPAAERRHTIHSIIKQPHTQKAPESAQSRRSEPLTESSASQKNKSEAQLQTGTVIPVPDESQSAPRRGRPPKTRASNVVTDQTQSSSAQGMQLEMKSPGVTSTPASIPRRRGRPSKNQVPVSATGEGESRPAFANQSINRNGGHEEEKKEEDEEGEEEDAAAEPNGTSEQVLPLEGPNESDFASEEGSEKSDGEILDDLDQVFKILDTPRRRGDCATEEGASIAWFCREAIQSSTKSNWTLEDIACSAKNLRKQLEKCGANANDAKLKSIKLDTHAYLFRDLVRYLAMIFNWLEENHGPIDQSLPSAEIMLLVIGAIISLKDKISTWKGPMPHHDFGNRLIKDIESKIIVPLRAVQKQYCKVQTELKTEAINKMNYDRIRQRSMEKAQEAAQKQKNEELYYQKKLHWQDLHLIRQKYEPDWDLRKRLFFRTDEFERLLKQSEERDANGQKFERLPVFKERESPMARHSLPITDVIWEDANIEALIEGLRKYYGPDVFPTIFADYCSPSPGELRRYTVFQIAAQAAYIRTEMIERYREHDWEIPDWVKQIPILP
ncbi:unnamed protein product [Periconia digitata]|uniref:Uncharacterized protein n=1 Tax=Periconia digitata TaxID=1303443 RepID=A0A9W4UDU1_9PLEO|nr:unnamed protein product [Periconia digitata]